MLVSLARRELGAPGLPSSLCNWTNITSCLSSGVPGVFLGAGTAAAGCWWHSEVAADGVWEGRKAQAA